MQCSLCPRRCNKERGTDDTFCRMPQNPVVAKADLHFWEEPVISGENGSGTVFFSGCSLKCIYCQNMEISSKSKGKPITVNRLAEIFKELEKKGAHNINLVSPTHYALAIKEALEIYKPEIPVVYNSSGYENEETLKMLEGLIDIFLIDFKYVKESKALEYSAARDYLSVAKRAIAECYRQQPESIVTNGIMEKGVIVRHLLLPQSTKDAMEIFDWVRENTPNAYFSIMSQYIPLHKAKNHPVIGRKITKREYDKVVDYILSFDFPNVFIQEMSSAKTDFIPPFDFKGV